MPDTLLEKTRMINKLLQNNAGMPVDFGEIANVLCESIEGSIYIIDPNGRVLGYCFRKNFSCETMTDILESEEGFPADYNESLLRFVDTHANFSQTEHSCVFTQDITCKYGNKVTTIVPIKGSGYRLGTLILAKFETLFTDEDLILAEYAATLVGMEILRTRAGRLEEEARKKAAVQVALGTLSFSEMDAICHIFNHLDGDEGLLVASKIADKVGITRSVIVNALRKFESAGVIESKSLGMKGTYIRVLNDYLLKELEKYNQHVQF